MKLAYATSPIGGSHMRGDQAYFELFSIPEPFDRLEWKGKETSPLSDGCTVVMFPPVSGG